MTAIPVDRAVLVMGLRPLVFWDCGFESLREKGVLSLVCVCCVLSRRGLCDGQITRPEESHRPLCVAVCDLETSWMRRSWPTGGGGGGLCAKKKQKKIMRYELNVRCDCKEGLGVCGLLHRSVTDCVSNDVHCAQINYFFKQSNILGPFFFTFMWPCIVTNFFIMKPTRFTNFTNLFCHETLYVSDSSSVHRPEFIHRALCNDICHTGS